MFGENTLAGQYDYFADEKNRMFLPRKTGREKGNVVYFCYDKDIEHYVIYSELEILKKMDAFDEKIDSAKTVEELKQYKLMSLEFANSIIKKCSVDAAGRIVLPKEISGPTNIHMVGAGKCLILIPENQTKTK